MLSASYCCIGLRRAFLGSTRAVEGFIHPVDEGVAAGVDAGVEGVTAAVAAAHQTHVLLSLLRRYPC